MRHYLLALFLLAVTAVFGAPMGASAQEEIKTVSATDPVQFDPEKIVGHAKPWQMNYQEAVTPVMEKLVDLHEFVLWIIIAISVFVLALLIYIAVRFNAKTNPEPAKFTHNATVEVVWTVIPIIILVAIAIPSLRVHYNYSDSETKISSAAMTIKVKGHQWYWNYEYPEEGIAFDSYMKQDADLLPGEPRLLATDNKVVVPVNTSVRLQVTGADVIHSWAMPAFGVKQDTVPGRLNETWFKATKEGIYYGQCSELCGKYHGFMPIEVHVVSEELYKEWVAYAKTKFASDGTRSVAGIQ